MKTESISAQPEDGKTQSERRTLSDNLLTRLSHCDTLDEVKAWVKEEGRNLREDAYIATAVFDNILKKNQTNLRMYKISEYICDPTFHPPGTSFISHLVRYIIPRSWDVSDWKLLRTAVGSATELGLVSVEDVQKILGKVITVQKLRLRNVDGPIKNGRDRARLYMACGILESLERSTVLQITDLDPTLLCKLFSRFADRPELDFCKKMLWRLLPWASKHHIDLVRRLVLRHLQQAHRRDFDDAAVGQELAERLARANPDFLHLILANTTEGLLAFTRRSNTLSYRFMWHHWCGVLAVLGSSSFGVSLSTHSWDSLQSSHSTLPPDQRLLTFLWTAFAMGQSQRTSVDLSDKVHFLDGFERLVSTLPAFSQDLSEAAIGRFSNLALPRKDVLFRYLPRLLKSAAIVDTMPATEEGVSSSIIDKHIRNVHIEYSEEVGQFLQSPPYDLAAFKILSRRMIKKSTASFGILCHLLENHTELKIALQMPQKPNQLTAESQVGLQRRYKASSVDLSAPLDAKGTTTLQSDCSITDSSSSTKADKASHAGLSTLTNIERRLSPDSEPSIPYHSSLTKERVIDLINHLAMAFATSPVATPRAALRRVYWCYLFLCRYGSTNSAGNDTSTMARWCDTIWQGWNGSDFIEMDSLALERGRGR